MNEPTVERPPVKCVVWDLDGTVWDGILLESGGVKLRHGILDIITTLDSRGILNSIASRNDYEIALSKLREFGIDKYFLCPEINWNDKSLSISRIQRNLDIATDTILFIDDNYFERDEVQYVHPDVTCMDAVNCDCLLELQRLKPRFITPESGDRRLLYMQNMERKGDAERSRKPRADFLRTLNMCFCISEAKVSDLKRAEELTVRTNQLNTTGRTYDYSELKALLDSERHIMLLSELTDKYGSHGKIGLALIEIKEEFWYLRLFLMSCRVIPYGVGTVFLIYIMNEAKKNGKKLRVDYKKSDRNRMMYVAFKFANFLEIESNDAGNILLENDLADIQEFPSYIDVIAK